MGWRFRRRVRVLPGITLNLGKSGASVSMGVRGAHVTVGKTGVRSTVGLPGTGISYTSLQRPGRAFGSPSRRRHSRRAWIIAWVGIALIFALVAALDFFPPPPGTAVTSPAVTSAPAR